MGHNSRPQHRDEIPLQHIGVVFRVSYRVLAKDSE
jgi:hypothetical protein